jgi:hypothetical protein
MNDKLLNEFERLRKKYERTEEVFFLLVTLLLAVAWVVRP